MPSAGLNDGLLQCMDLFKMYWVLSDIVQNESIYHNINHSSQITTESGLSDEINSNSNSKINDISTEKTIKFSDVTIREIYGDLIKFMNNPDISIKEFRPSFGYHRRCFRILCDELKLQHKLVFLEMGGTKEKRTKEKGDHFLKNMDGGVRVWKLEGSERIEPPSLEEILRKDALRGQNRRFDMSPYKWTEVSAHLLCLPSRTLGKD